MRGSLKNIAKNTWQIELHIGYDPQTGKRIRKWATVHGTKRFAERERARLVTELSQGTYVDPSRMTLSEYLDQWYADYARANVRPRTLEGYQTIIRNHLKPRLGAIKLSSLSPHHLQRYYATMLTGGRKDGKSGGLSAQTIKHHREVLSSALNDAVMSGLLHRNVAAVVTPPRVPRSPLNVLDRVGLAKLLETAKETPYYALIHLAAYTGLRRSELLGLRWSDVNLEARLLSVAQVAYRLRGSRGMVFEQPKTDKSRQPIRLSEASALVLRAHRERQEAQFDRKLYGGLVFCNDNGEPLKSDSVTHAFKRIARKAGIETVSLQGLRHTHGSLLLQAGVNLKVVQDRLRHASMTTTYDRYVHLLPGAEEDAVEAFDREVRGSA